ncbi:hypothetical protein [Oceanithermus sp.]|uniref:hypothetical protein n=1 Tax=Oceanithermus sp. TaxID=2268145 RepID=UPI00257C6C2D|nr:hypothetical protein [Oceanithermus sp.]
MKTWSITDIDIRHALNELERRGARGLPRSELAAHFGSDRKGRAVMAAIVERGIAAIVTANNPAGSGQVYRLAQSDADIEREDRELLSRIARLERRRAGLRQAWEAGGVREEQPALLGVGS